MDNGGVIVLAMAIGGLTIVGGVVINMVLSAVARYRAAERQVPPSDERLARIEHAVEAIALEVERLGEMQRFNAKLEAQRVPESRQVERPITPV